MEEENYNILLEKLQAYDQKISELEEKIKDVTAFNKTLLNTSAPVTSTPKEDRLAKLEEKLKGAFH